MNTTNKVNNKEYNGNKVLKPVNILFIMLNSMNINIKPVFTRTPPLECLPLLVPARFLLLLEGSTQYGLPWVLVANFLHLLWGEVLNDSSLPSLDTVYLSTDIT